MDPDIQPLLHRVLDTEDDSERVRLLCEAWRRTRSPDLAALVDVAQDRLDYVDLSDRDALIQSLTDRRDDHLPGILDVLSEDPSAHGLLGTLHEWLDPRVSAWCGRHVLVGLEGLRNADAWGRRIWREALSVLVSQADPRSAPVVRRLLVDERVPEELRQFVRDAHQDLVDRVRLHSRALADGEVVLVGPIRSLLLPETEDALLDAVYREPGNLDARLVLADALIERGDPRGEFIHLSLLAVRTTAQETRRMSLLLANHRTWLGPLAVAVDPATVGWESGFPASVRLFGFGPGLSGLVGHPAWSTVHTIEVADRASRGTWGSSTLDRLLLHVVLRNLRVLRGDVPRGTLTRVLHDGWPPRLHTLAIPAAHLQDPYLLELLRLRDGPVCLQALELTREAMDLLPPWWRECPLGQRVALRIA